VNTPDFDSTLTIVDNAFRFDSGAEVTTTMAQPVDDRVFYFNAESYLAYRSSADATIKADFAGMDPLNCVAILVNELVEAEKVHEFRTTGRITDAGGNVVFVGDRNSAVDRLRAHRGIRREDGTWDGGHADTISTEAERAFREHAKLPLRGEDTPNFTGGFWTWPNGASEADGALLVAFTRGTKRVEMVIYHDARGAFVRLEKGSDAVRKFFSEWQRRQREESGR
jgi:hypothetical protein